MKHKINIMESVDILDRVDIVIFQPSPGSFTIDFVCKEKGKQLTIDEKALETLQNKINELTVGKNAKDPVVRGYMEEFTGKLLQQYHKVNLAVIEDVQGEVSDHYAAFRKTLN